tara:strand:- start:1117 stop:1371 length:255 start_codon:yes stop_codon:yes gene_type:complete
MSINFQQIAPIIAACVTTGGIVFQIGKQSERIDTIGFKVEAQEKKTGNVDNIICGMDSKLNIISNDLNHLGTDIKEIKERIKVM